MSDTTPIFGIDLGTTYSCIAVVPDGSGKADVIAGTDGQTTPSVVYFESEHNVIVGKQAKANAKLAPALVCSTVKREMGNDGYRFEAWGKQYRAEEISGLILKKVVNDAVQQNGYPTDRPFRAVITVPAYFGSKEREATRNAGRLAGLEVVSILPEPVAAAFAYGLSRARTLQHVLVFDLGGGTFDVTVVRVDGTAAHCLVTDGIRKLGGADWDAQIMRLASERFLAEHGAADGDPKDDPDVAQRLLIEAEETKIALSSRDRSAFLITHAGKQTRVDITRSDFEQRTADLMDQAIERTKAVLEAAKQQGVTKIDKLLLVGGSSKMPVVKRRLKDELGLEGEMYRPDQSVAEGAALVGRLIETGEYNPGAEPEPAVSPGGAMRGLPSPPKLGFVSAKSLGVVAVRGDQPDQKFVDYIIKRNTRLPASATETYGTIEDNQRAVSLIVKEQREEESEIIDENETLHEAPLALPAGLRKNTPIEVTFGLDLEGVLIVTAIERTSGNKLDVKVERRGMLSEAELASRATAMARMKVS